MHINDCIVDALARPLLYLFYGGIPSADSSYSRFDTGYSIDSDGLPVAVATDVPMYKDVVTGGVTNLVLINGVPVDGVFTNMTVVAPASGLTQVVLGDGLRYYKLETTISSGYIEFEGEVGTTDECMFSIWGLCSNVTGAFLSSTDGNITDFPTGAAFRINGSITPSGTTVKMRINISNGVSVFFRLPQITVGSDLKDDVPALPTGASAGGSTYKAYLNYADPNQPSGFPAGVNQPSLSIPAGPDIDTASYLFDSAQSDRITLDNPIILGTDDFIFEGNIRIGSLGTTQGLVGELENGAFSVSINNTSGSVLIIESGVAIVYTSLNPVSINTDTLIRYERNFSGNSYLYINGVQETVSDNRNYAGRTSLLCSRLTGGFLNGYAWGFSLSVNGVQNFSYTLADYRRDRLIIDTSGSGNNAQTSRAINLLISENDAFGYPVNEKAPTLNGKTVNDIFNGAAEGSELLSDLTADIVSNSGGCNGVINGQEFSNDAIGTNSGYPRFRWNLDGTTVSGSRYYITGLISGDINEVTLMRLNTSGIDEKVDYDSATGAFCCYVTVVNPSSIMEISTDGTAITSCTLESCSVKQVAPAEGTTIFEDFKIAEVTTPELVTNGDFATDTDWTKGTGVTISGGSANFVATAIANNSLYQNMGLEDGKVFLLRADAGNYVAGTLTAWSGGVQNTGDNAIRINADGSYTCFINLTEETGANGNLIFGAIDAVFTGSIDNVEVREIIPLTTREDGTPMMYIDPFDSKVKLYDGTNTAESNVAITADVYHTFWESHRDGSVWITLNDDKGIEADYEEFEVGNRVLYAASSSIYHDGENAYWDDELAFAYVIDEITGEPSIDEITGERVTEYL